MTSHRRPTAVAALLLLLSVVFAPSLAVAASAPLTGTGVTAVAVQPASAPPAASAASAVPVGERGERTPEARPAAGSGDTGGSCRPLDVPLKGAEAVAPAGHADPLTAPAATRATLSSAPAPRPGAPRAPPVPVAGCAELLPVLRI
ncbi:hypothetical protein [Streptomyces albireticuli]|uniref:Uncharacterized protein n=1 Tax=Streptomyces albireticuli TaxID=1940 RepID=A0A2A2DAM8_9ACTN|nr:hypothetical protein [Streptomyces albireticuli]MCD9141588.1 hypothetical protein [Streptomyces albireticuli]MCD9164161.1 hypothetical protein [Streptomyces albireticuli]MCD9189762.1 hypothetical protein [Streptomyces albireticuli]PAU49528.1 hypothetical protein CK936_07165 [Streptomyces albireticuli]